MIGSSGRKDLSFKSFVLVCLAVQTSGLTLLMRYARIVGGDKFDAGKLIVLVELIKLILSLMGIFVEEGWSLSRSQWVILEDWKQQPVSKISLAVPAFLYSIQNNLCYSALGYLPVVQYQLVYQMKTLTTAGFTVLLLKRKLTWQHWFALILLMIGVGWVQIMTTNTSSTRMEMTNSSHQQWIGFLLLGVSSLTSGFASVYFELMTKDGVKRRSLWLQSWHLGVFGLFFSFWFGFMVSGWRVLKWDLTALELFVTVMQATSGMLVAMVIKYADNILKTFATSFSVLLSAFIMTLVGKQDWSWSLLIGCVLVLSSSIWYARAGPITSSVPVTTSGLKRKESGIMPRTRNSIDNYF